MYMGSSITNRTNNFYLGRVLGAFAIVIITFCILVAAPELSYADDNPIGYTEESVSDNAADTSYTEDSAAKDDFSSTLELFKSGSGKNSSHKTVTTTKAFAGALWHMYKKQGDNNADIVLQLLYGGDYGADTDTWTPYYGYESSDGTGEIHVYTTFDGSDTNDATYTQNVINSLTMIDKCNAIRKAAGLNELKVSLHGMIISSLQLNWTVAYKNKTGVLDHAGNHGPCYGWSEIIAWNMGTTGSFDGWYTQEKAILQGAFTALGLGTVKDGTAYTTYAANQSKIDSWIKSNKGSGATVGHYICIVNPNYTVAGAAVSGTYTGMTFNDGEYFTGRSYNPFTGIVGNRKFTPTNPVTYTTTQLRTALNKALADTSGSTSASTQKMYRLYNPNSGEHFYTAATSERDHLKKVGWNYEGVGWTAPTSSKTPVYRLYSGTDHHYTTDASEKNYLVKVGWNYEGIGWYSDDNKGVPLYRQFNPYVNPRAKYNNSGSHNYTTSKAENDNLVKVGWRAEGIGWYGVKA